jgi:hypothetical protein
MINVYGGNPFILTKEKFKKSAALLSFNEGVDIIDEP